MLKRPDNSAVTAEGNFKRHGAKKIDPSKKTDGQSAIQKKPAGVTRIIPVKNS